LNVRAVRFFIWRVIQHLMCLYYPRYSSEPVNQTINQQYPRGAPTLRANINFSSQGQRSKVKVRFHWGHRNQITSSVRHGISFYQSALISYQFLIIIFQFLCRQTNRQTHVNGSDWRRWKLYPFCLLIMTGAQAIVH